MPTYACSNCTSLRLHLLAVTKSVSLENILSTETLVASLIIKINLLVNIIFNN